MPNKCTWQDPPDKDCSDVAKHPQTSKDGSVWANLCDKHAAMLDKATDYLLAENRDPKESAAKMLGSWVRASGGAKRMAKRMMGEGEPDER